MDNVPWFKFNPSAWMMGKIQRCEEVTQARFIRLCSLYWSKGCEMTIEDAIIEIDEDHFNTLKLKKIVATDSNRLYISFLDEQIIDIKEDSKDKSTSGTIGNLKRWHKDIYEQFVSKKISLEKAIELSKVVAKQSPSDRTPIATGSQNIADIDKIRLDEEKKRKEVFKKLNISLLSEIKISDENLIYFKDFVLECSDEERINFKTAVWFQKLFIKNLKNKNSPCSDQEKAKYKNYVDPIRLMFDVDKVTREQVKEAYAYLDSLEGEFWKNQILSTSTLRKQISKILMQKNSKNGTKQQQSSIGPKKAARFTIAGAEKTILADAERKQREMEERNSAG